LYSRGYRLSGADTTRAVTAKPATGRRAGRRSHPEGPGQNTDRLAGEETRRPGHRSAEERSDTVA
jgi:hypothetical protein